MCGCERHWDCRSACNCNCKHHESECSSRSKHPGQRNVYEDGIEPPTPYTKEEKIRARKAWDARVDNALPDGALS
jgi:hypothetical protein